MNRCITLLTLICLPLLASAESGSIPERTQLERACQHWADMEQVQEIWRGPFISQCVAGLEHELEETGSVELD